MNQIALDTPKSKRAVQPKTRTRRLSPQLVRERRNSLPQITYASDLPIVKHLPRIEELLRTNQVVIIAGETGSGKTTQLPLACLKAGLGVSGTIAHTQPRRLAARSVAGRIAEQLNVKIGEQVGYAVRFDEQWNRRSLVKVMTDGMLLAEVNHDRDLRNYEVVIVDEAHERTLNVDFLIGLLHRLIDKRPELKVVITSATIDVESFSQHFGGAPVVSVEGRGYPVHLEYRPPKGGDVESAVFGSIEEILDERKEGVRDILMFLPTEQEILEWSHKVRRRWPKELEVLPLYARLPPRDQQRIFQTSKRRRILLSTNVAETSLTVPNIRYVIDLGEARISRYSARSRVQRLPIESISQASADQRKGRCGRVAAGTCFRIYDESQFELASQYTDPEIKRTNLASVLLQTKVLRLGDMSQFPFIEKPDVRSIGEAERLLHELGALVEGKLTQLGRQMSRIPIDPRFARILIESAHRGALQETLIIVAALSAQDPRFRPHNQREAADNAHERFSDEQSDFLSFVNVWRWAERERQRLSSSSFRKLLERNYIAPNRYFEWRSLHRQLSGFCQRLGFKRNSKPAKYSAIHKAILSGSLSLIGFKETKNVYLGIQDLRFRLFPGSRLAKSQPKWVVASEIVDTGRVHARVVASVERRWLEEMGSKLLRISYFDQHWDERRGEAMILSRATLYGLPVYERRPCRLAPMNAAEAREIFVDHALVQPKDSNRWPFLKQNTQLRDRLTKIQARERRTDIVVSPRRQANFYLERLPGSVVNLKSFEAWYSTASGHELKQLLMEKSDLMVRPDEDLENAAFPGALIVNEKRFPLAYRYAPGDKADGVSIRVRAEDIDALSPDCIEWLVPGRFPEKCTELLRSLPKHYRRHLVPIPERVAQISEHLLSPSRFRIGNFYVALSETIRGFYNVDIPLAEWDEEKLSPFLRMNVQWMGHRGRIVDQDRDLHALRGRHEKTLSDALELESHEREVGQPLVEFPKEGMEAVRRLKRKGTSFSVFPALVDKLDHVVVELAVNSDTQSLWQEKGLSRLFLLASGQSVRYIAREFQIESQMHMQMAKVIDPKALLDFILMATSRHVYLQSGSEFLTRTDFDKRLAENRGRLVKEGLAMLTLCSDLAQKRFDVSFRIEQMKGAVLSQAKEDLEQQLLDLMPADFLWRTPYDRLAELPRYLAAMSYRIEHLQGRVKKDAELMALAQNWEQRLNVLVQKVGEIPELVEAKFLLAEQRIALFHQRLGTKEKVSQKRLEEHFDRLESTYAHRKQ